MAEGDPNRFEGMARQVADIRLDGPAVIKVPTAAQQGLRPAIASAPEGRLKVEVMDPHDLWDARDDELGTAIGLAEAKIAARAVEGAAPIVAEAVVQGVTNRVVEARPMRPAIARDTVGSYTTIQLGAYSSPEAALAAWVAVSRGTARNVLTGLSPMFEPVQVNGRPFTRLKVAAPSAAAAAICHAAEVTDPWCDRLA